MTSEPRDAPHFYMTAPSPCPYLEGQVERKVFTHLIGRRALSLHDALAQSGFRRSQTIAYRPACAACALCVSVRVPVDDFRPSRTMRRIVARNADLHGAVVPSHATAERYDLFRAYVDARHPDGGMADMTVIDFAMMLEDSHVETALVEYRDESGDVCGFCLTDLLADGVSMVYSVYDPAAERRSLGAYMILDHIARARALGLPYVYLGYWVEGSPKMAYKARYMPQERLTTTGWTLVV